MKIKQGSSAIFVLCILLTLLLFLRPDEASNGIKRGLSICAGTLIPSLFPFMVISEMLVRSGLGRYAARYLERPMQKLFGVSGGGAGALILGILCGFPVGAKTAYSLCLEGDISKKDAESLLTFCNFPSAPFMIFAVGDGLFGSRELGTLLYISALTGGLLCGIIGGAFGKKRRDTIRSLPAAKSTSSASIFTESVTNAASALISVCAYVTFFTCFVSTACALLGNSNDIFKAILFSFFELTSGASACAAISNGIYAAILCSAAASWSGISVFFQISSLAPGISMRPYLISKTFSAPLSALITAITLKAFPQLIPKTPSATDVFLSFRLYPDALIHSINTIFMLSLIFYLIKLLDRRALI